MTPSARLRLLPDVPNSYRSNRVHSIPPVIRSQSSMATGLQRWWWLGLVGLGAFGFAAVLWYGIRPKDLAKYDAEGVFRGWVCSPIPPSVKNVKAEGYVAFAGSQGVIDFTFEGTDLPSLLSCAQLVPVDPYNTHLPRHPPWIHSSHLCFTRSERAFVPGSWLFLYVDTNSWVGRFYFGK